MRASQREEYGKAKMYNTSEKNRQVNGIYIHMSGGKDRQSRVSNEREREGRESAEKRESQGKRVRGNK